MFTSPFCSQIEHSKHHKRNTSPWIPCRQHWSYRGKQHTCEGHLAEHNFLSYLDRLISEDITEHEPDFANNVDQFYSSAVRSNSRKDTLRFGSFVQLNITATAAQPRFLTFCVLGLFGSVDSRCLLFGTRALLLDWCNARDDPPLSRVLFSPLTEQATVEIVDLGSKLQLICAYPMLPADPIPVNTSSMFFIPRPVVCHVQNRLTGFPPHSA